VPGRVLYDTGSEVGLISQRFADDNDIEYGSCSVCVCQIGDPSITVIWHDIEDLGRDRQTKNDEAPVCCRFPEGLCLQYPSTLPLS